MTPASAARVYRGSSGNLAFLARRLRAGDLVAVPTETVYGLAANALEAGACQKIFQAKRRPLGDPLIVHIHAWEQFDQLCRPNPLARKIAERFWPGPLTLILPRTDLVPDIVTSGQPSVALRMPAHPLFRRLLKLAGIPLAAPSANPFGYVSPTTAEHVRLGLGKRIRHILDGGPAQIGLESTILDLRDPAKPRLLRPGAIVREELEAALGRALLGKRRTSTNQTGAQLAPGLLARHYSPRTPLSLHRRLVASDDPRQAFVFLARPAGRKRRNVFWLDQRGQLTGVARRLFALLRSLDAKKFTRIHVELAPEEGLGVAINDRLRRAAAR